MIKWITESLGTSAMDKLTPSDREEAAVVDVRDLVDKEGNRDEVILEKIDEAVGLLKKNRKVIICCDYGMSRSNSIAVGVLVKWKVISFEDAFSLTKKVIKESEIKVEVLNQVYNALNLRQIKKSAPTNYHSRTICITGSTGFIGSNVVSALQGDFSLVCPSRKEINLINNSIEFDLLVKAKNVGTIIHLANPTIITHTQSMGEALVMLKNVLDTCRMNDIELIYLSGWEIYSGYKSLQLLAGEDLAPFPKGTYGETKWFCELLIKQYALVYGVKYKIVRTGPIFGVGADRPKFIYNFIERALVGQVIQTHRYLNGSPSLDLLYIDDFLSFLRKYLAKSQSTELHVGSGKPTTTFDIASLICRLTDSKSEIVEVLINGHTPNIVMDCMKVKNELDWVPRVSVENGLKKILEKYL